MQRVQTWQKLVFGHLQVSSNASFFIDFLAHTGNFFRSCGYHSFPLSPRWKEDINHADVGVYLRTAVIQYQSAEWCFSASVSDNYPFYTEGSCYTQTMLITFDAEGIYLHITQSEIMGKGNELVVEYLLPGNLSLRFRKALLGEEVA